MSILNLTTYTLNLELKQGNIIAVHPSGLKCSLIMTYKKGSNTETLKFRIVEVKAKGGVSFKGKSYIDLNLISNKHYDFVIVTKEAGLKAAANIKETLKSKYNITYTYLGIIDLSKDTGYFKKDKKLKKDTWVFKYVPVVSMEG